MRVQAGRIRGEEKRVWWQMCQLWAKVGTDSWWNISDCICECLQKRLTFKLVKEICPNQWGWTSFKQLRASMEQFYIHTHTYIWVNLLCLLGVGHPSSCSDTGAPGSQSFELQDLHQYYPSICFWSLLHISSHACQIIRLTQNYRLQMVGLLSLHNCLSQLP